MHNIEDILMLKLDFHADLFAHLLQILHNLLKGFAGCGNIHYHHHVEVILYDGL
ncbi:hypothetical protein D3C81_1942970 [compost metagenome]